MRIEFRLKRVAVKEHRFFSNLKREPKNISRNWNLRNSLENNIIQMHALHVRVNIVGCIILKKFEKPTVI